MSNNIKVSVIIPVYNVEDYLQQSLESVINQTLKEIEIICVDDGSTDNSLEILNQYAKKDNRIKIYKQNNLGAGHARNVGLSLAKGEFISFLDSDDFFELDMLETAYNKIIQDKSDIVYFDFNRYDDKNKSYSIKPNISQLLSNSYCFNPRDVKFNFLDLIYPNAWSKLFRLDFIKKYNIKFDTLKICNDIAFVLSALSIANKISILPRTLVHYRYNTGKNLTANRSKYSHLIVNALLSIYSFMKQNGLLNIYKTIFYKCMLNKINFETNRSDINSKKQIQIYFNKTFNNELNIDLDTSINKFNRIIENNKIKVSVIIPVYNASKFLSKCLESVINQTLKEIEIICVDDGSDDDSFYILNNYLLKEKRLRVFSKMNNGQSSARNLALQYCKGKYVQCLDSDDCLEKTALEKLYNMAENNHLDLIHFGVKRIYVDTNEKEINQQQFLYLKENKYLYTKNDLKQIFYNMPVSIVYFYNREKTINNIRFVEGLKFEDNLFLLQVLNNVERFGVLKEYLYERTLYSGQTTSLWDKLFNDYIKIINLIINLPLTDFYDKSSQYKIIQKYINIAFSKYKDFDLNSKNKYLKIMYDLLIKAKAYVSLTKNQEMFLEKSKSEINKCLKTIVFSFDSNVIQQFIVSVYSLLKSINEQINIICLITDDVSSEDKALISEKLSEFEDKFMIKYINMDKIVNTSNSFEIRNITKPAYFRLFIHKTDLTGIVLYSDIDVVFKKNPFTALNCLKTKPIAAVRAVNFGRKDYFNSGFLVMNIEKYKEVVTKYDLLSLIKKENKFQDQDIINDLFKNNIDIVPPKYCYIPSSENRYRVSNGLYSQEEINELKSPVIIHYAGKKPWIDSNVQLSKDWFNIYNEAFNKSDDTNLYTRKQSIDVNKTIIEQLIGKSFINQTLAVVKKNKFDIKQYCLPTTFRSTDLESELKLTSVSDLVYKSDDIIKFVKSVKTDNIIVEKYLSGYLDVYSTININKQVEIKASCNITPIARNKIVLVTKQLLTKFKDYEQVVFAVKNNEVLFQSIHFNAIKTNNLNTIYSESEVNTQPILAEKPVKLITNVTASKSLRYVINVTNCEVSSNVLTLNRNTIMSIIGNKYFIPRIATLVTSTININTLPTSFVLRNYNLTEEFVCSNKSTLKILQLYKQVNDLSQSGLVYVDRYLINCEDVCVIRKCNTFIVTVTKPVSDDIKNEARDAAIKIFLKFDKVKKVKFLLQNNNRLYFRGVDIDK